MEFDTFTDSFTDFIVKMVDELQDKFGDDFECQFEREIKVRSGQISLSYYLNVFLEIATFISKKLEAVENAKGWNLISLKETNAEVFSDVQNVILENIVVPYKEMIKMFKNPIKSVKFEIVHLLLKTVQNQNSKKEFERINFLLDLCFNLLKTNKEEAPIIEVYYAVMCLKDNENSEESTQQINQTKLRIIKGLYQSGYKIKAKELLKNLSISVSLVRVQEQEQVELLKLFSQKYGLPSITKNSPKSTQNLHILNLLDVMTYLNISELSDEYVLESLENFEGVLKLKSQQIKAHVLSKKMFANSILKMNTHIEYFYDFYSNLVEFVLVTKESDFQKLLLEFDEFLNAKFVKKQIKSEYYLIQKIHIALYLDSSSSQKIKFQHLEILTNIFANEQYSLFKKIMDRVYFVYSGEKLAKNEAELVQFFSGRKFQLSDFDFLKVKIKYRTNELIQEIVPTQNAQITLNIHQNLKMSMIAHAKKTLDIQMKKHAEIQNKRASESLGNPAYDIDENQPTHPNIGDPILNKKINENGQKTIGKLKFQKSNDSSFDQNESESAFDSEKKSGLCMVDGSEFTINQNIVKLMSGRISPSDFEALKNSRIQDFVINKPQNQVIDGIRHEYVFVQRVGRNSPCKNEIDMN